MTMPARPLVRIKRLSPLATVPAYQSEHAAGLDLHAAIDDPIVLGPGDIRLVPCGFAMAVPDGFEAQVRPRSGLASRHGISMPNAPGTIDADYRGEVQVPLINLSRQPFTIEPGESLTIAEMDRMIDALKQIAEEARSDPDKIRNAPHNAAIAKIDEDVPNDPDCWAFTYRGYQRKKDFWTSDKRRKIERHHGGY